MHYTLITTPDETSVKRLLRECGLPVADVDANRLKHFFGVGDASGMIGVAGLELHGDVALLRSVAVAPNHRSTGLGKRLVAHVERHARAHGVRAIYLLTTTADAFFSRLGYASMARIDAPPAIRSTSEFSHVCPSSSVLMVKRLGG